MNYDVKENLKIRLRLLYEHFNN